VQRKSKRDTGQVIIVLPYLNSPLYCYVHIGDKLQRDKYTVTFPNPHPEDIKQSQVMII
jgi:hypothetical protein